MLMGRVLLLRAKTSPICLKIRTKRRGVEEAHSRQGRKRREPRKSNSCLKLLRLNLRMRMIIKALYKEETRMMEILVSRTKRTIQSRRVLEKGRLEEKVTLLSLTGLRLWSKFLSKSASCSIFQRKKSRERFPKSKLQRKLSLRHLQS